METSHSCLKFQSAIEIGLDNLKKSECL